MKKLFAYAVLLATAASAQAGSYTIYGDVSAAYTPNLSFNLPADFYNLSGVHLMDLYLLYQKGSDAKRGFGSLTFDITFTGNSVANNSDVPGWLAGNPTVDTNGRLPGGNVPLFATNADTGISTTDLKDIQVSIAQITSPNVSDPRPMIGQGAGTYIGSIYVNYDGWGVESVNFHLTQASYAAASDGSLIPDTNTGSMVDRQMTVGTPDGWINDPPITPEPASLSLIGLGALGLLRRRRNA